MVTTDREMKKLVTTDREMRWPPPVAEGLADPRG